MNHSTPTPYFPDNLEDYAPWVAQHGLLHPYGICQCGCGQTAPVSGFTHADRGVVKGKPARFIHGHAIRIQAIPRRRPKQYLANYTRRAFDPKDLPPIVPIPNYQVKDLAGMIVGRLTVLGYVGKNQYDQSLWLCRCECGQHCISPRTSLVAHHAYSCGCLGQEARDRANTKHGMAGTPEWHCWVSMINRCMNPGATGYEYWGGRGITVCNHWRDNFENFFADLGPKPGEGHEFSIDRIDTNGHYSCGHCDQCKEQGWTANCRWATLEEQRNNTRRNHYLEFQGERLTIKQWAKRLHMHHDALYYRIRAGWSVERALTTPAKRYD